MTAGLIIMPPIVLTDAMLVSDTVDETLPVFNPATTYAAGDRVVIAATHMIFESAVAGNVGHYPPTSTDAHWLVVGKTNRWRMWDNRSSSVTAKAGGFYAEATTGQVVTSVWMDYVVADSVRVRVTDPVAGVVYDRSVDFTALPQVADHWYWFFGVREAPEGLVLLDLPAYPNATVRVDVAGANAAVGNCVLSQHLVYGEGVEFGFEIGNQDFSVVSANPWGDMVLRPGEQAPTQSLQTVLRKGEVTMVRNRLRRLAARAAVYMAWEDVLASAVFGVVQDHSITPTDAQEAVLKLQVKGIANYVS
ncbi:MAG TPA: hypothetical protein PKD73_06075 [Burkholderiaceae bacterium]|nr:hypothetical protein [Burkholderiaceae bacterium]